MFGRGSWALFGIKTSSQTKFEMELNDPKASQELSQTFAMNVTRTQELPSMGINPYDRPRGDEAEVPVMGTTEDYRLGPQQFGFWLVINEYEDVTDPKSKQEGLSYETATKPFKFLKKEEKTHVESLVKASAVVSRRQFPVLIDFVGERVYAETTDAEEIGDLRRMLENCGAQVYSLSWQFGGHNWTTKFLNAINSENKFANEMQSRAEDLRRFRADEVEELEDKLMESVVSSFFALSQLDTGQWAGLSTPAKIRLYLASEPSSEASVSTAFTLLTLTDQASVASASVTFQDLGTKFNKKTDSETQFRTDLFCIDINDKVNIQDAGAAALRGFDMPQYKKDMKRHGKDRGSLGIRDYWLEWLIGMKNSINILVENILLTILPDSPDRDELGLKTLVQEETEEAAV